MTSFIRKSASFGSHASAPKGSPAACAAVRMAYAEAVPEWEYRLQTGLERGIVREREPSSSCRTKRIPCSLQCREVYEYSVLSGMSRLWMGPCNSFR